MSKPRGPPAVLQCEVPSCSKVRIVRQTDARWYDENRPPPHRFECAELWHCKCADPADDDNPKTKSRWIGRGGRALIDGPEGHIPPNENPTNVYGTQQTSSSSGEVFHVSRNQAQPPAARSLSHGRGRADDGVPARAERGEMVAGSAMATENREIVDRDVLGRGEDLGSAAALATMEDSSGALRRDRLARVENRRQLAGREAVRAPPFAGREKRKKRDVEKSAGALFDGEKLAGQRATQKALVLQLDLGGTRHGVLVRDLERTRFGELAASIAACTGVRQHLVRFLKNNGERVSESDLFLEQEAPRNRGPAAIWSREEAAAALVEAEDIEEIPEALRLRTEAATAQRGAEFPQLLACLEQPGPPCNACDVCASLHPLYRRQVAPVLCLVFARLGMQEQGPVRNILDFWCMKERHAGVSSYLRQKDQLGRSAGGPVGEVRWWLRMPFCNECRRQVDGSWCSFPNWRAASSSCFLWGEHACWFRVGATDHQRTVSE